MTKRKKKDKTEATVAVPNEGISTSSGDDEPTSPGAEDPSFDDDGDTQVGPAPADDWEAHTPAVAELEIAELAATSVDAGAGGAVDPAAEPPPVVAPGRLANIVESLLFASDRPLTLADLKRLVSERDGGKITAAVEDLGARRQESGIQVVQVAGGWQLRTNPENVPWVSRLLAGKPPRLSRAMLEALAIIAYRQPITRPEIDEIRGVDCGPVLKTLLDRSLVRMIGKKEEVGRPILYGTTPEFLRMFSLRDLSELPTLREFHELGAAEMAKVDAASPPRDEALVLQQAVRPSASTIHEPDPAEEDRLLADLEHAAALATKAATPRGPEPSASSAASEGAGPEGPAD
jgi:segregation and condensation protein B